MLQFHRLIQPDQLLTREFHPDAWMPENELAHAAGSERAESVASTDAEDGKGDQVERGR